MTPLDRLRELLLDILNQAEAEKPSAEAVPKRPAAKRPARKKKAGKRASRKART